MQIHHLANYQQRRRRSLLRQLFQFRQRAGQHLLILSRTAADDRHRCMRRPTMRDQLLADFRRLDRTHIDSQGLSAARQRRPLQCIAIRAAMPGDKYHALRVIPVRQRNAGIRRSAAAAVMPGTT